MLNPHSACKTPLSSRVAMPIALLLAGAFGLGISMMQPASISKIASAAAPAPAPVPAGVQQASFEDLPEESAVAVSSDDLVTFCSKHVTEKRSFVVFRRGTCVIVNEPCEDPLAEARKILGKCKKSDARFLTEPTA
ncbi:MAG: hypothetical protein EOP85_02790 [Verrucomicrobiaceae bacterium]|nr:MAG: hypothetical protein EOP85_02790 [Verrucomicrobiaceae bacterium]